MSRISGAGQPDYGAGTSQQTGVLYAGICQQPETSRFPNQVKDAKNTDFSVYDGASKRPGTELARVIDNTDPATELQTGEDYRSHAIRRTDVEQYNVIYGRGASDMLIRVFEEAGPEATVNITAGAQTYLNAMSSTAADIKMFTIADGTLIVNRNVATDLETSPSYTLSTTFKDADVMISNSPDEGSYHRALADGDDFVAGYYRYSQGADGRTFARWQCEKEHINWTGWDEFNSRDWGDPAKSDMGFRVGFRRVDVSGTGFTLAPSGSNYQLTAGSGTPFSGYTFEAGDMIRITGGTGVVFPGAETFGWATVISKDSSTQITVSEANVSGVLTYRAGTSVSLAAATTVNINGIGREYEVATDIPSMFASGDVTDLYDIAAAWQQAFQDVGEDDVTVSWIKIGTTGEWRITSPWKGGDALVYETQSPLVATYDMTADDRPFTNSSGEYNTYAGVAGTHPTNATARVPLQDRWTRTSAPSQPEWRPDATTMPLLMTRTSYTGDGTTPAVFDIDVITWDERLDGDEDTNPALSLLKEQWPIKDIAVHQERLWLFGGPYAAGSATGDFFRFFKDDFEQIADDDPIERQASGQSVVTIRNATPLRDVIVLETNAGSMHEVYARDNVWTPTSVAVRPTAGYETLDVRMAKMDDRMYFCARQHSPNASRIAAQIFEYDYDDGRAQNAGEEITKHVPLFFKDDIIAMQTVPAQGKLLVLTESEPSILYVWSTHYGPNNERRQSAWTKYEFSGRLVAMSLLLSGVQCLFETDDGVWTIERIRFEPDVPDNTDFTAGQYPRRLDRAMALTGVHSGGFTTWTLTGFDGGNFNDDAVNTVVLPDGTELTTTRPTSGTIRAAGNHVAVGNCRVGISYEMMFKPSKQYIRDRSGAGLPRDGMCIHRVSIPYRRTGAFTLTNTVDGNDYTRSFAPTTATAEEGTFTAYLGGMSQKCNYKVTSNNSRPVCIPAIQFDGHPVENVGS